MYHLLKFEFQNYPKGYQLEHAAVPLFTTDVRRKIVGRCWAREVSGTSIMPRSIMYTVHAC